MLPPIVDRFIAGKTVSGAVANTASARNNGIGIIFNLLGEHYTESADVVRDTKAYCELIDKISDVERTCVSVKPSQLGADIDSEVFKTHLEIVLKRAAEHDVFVWVDMEDSSTTRATLDTIRALSGEFSELLGVCVQANLRRTERDVRDLSGTGVTVRLVKGAYEEPEDIAFQSEERIDDQFRRLMTYLFEEFDGSFALGTHDPEMIELAEELSGEHDAEFEFQMLKGVRERAQRELAEEYDVWQYAPYGEKWPAYVWRRLREGRKNWRFILRALLSRG